MGQGGAGWVKNFSVGNFDGAPSTAHSSVLLILLNKLRESDKMRGSLSILSFYATSLINSIIQVHKC